MVINYISSLDLSSGLRKFTKLVKPPLAFLQLQHCLVSGYIEYLITIKITFSSCFYNFRLRVSLLDSLGFVIHPDKSKFCPNQDIQYLGFVINSADMTIPLKMK